MRRNVIVRTYMSVAVCFLGIPCAAEAWPYELRMIAHTGQETPTGGRFGALHGAAINDAGAIAFAGAIEDGPGRFGLFVYDGGATSVRSLSGMPYQNVGINASCTLVFRRDWSIYVNDGAQERLLLEGGEAKYCKPSINDSGHVLAFDGADIMRLVLHDGTSGHVLLREYAPLRDFRISEFGTTLSASDQYVFLGAPEYEYGIYLGHNTGYALIAEDDFYTMSLFDPPIVNDLGDVAFTAAPNTGQLKVFLHSGGQNVPVIQPGLVLDQGLGVQYHAVLAANSAGSNISLNNRRDIAFEYVDSGGTFQNRYGIGVLLQGEIVPIVREGDPVPGLPGVQFSREFGQLTIDDRGRVAFVSRLSDDTWGVFVAVPEPGSMALLTVAGLALVRRRRYAGNPATHAPGGSSAGSGRWPTGLRE